MSWRTFSSGWGVLREDLFLTAALTDDLRRVDLDVGDCPSTPLCGWCKSTRALGNAYRLPGAPEARTEPRLAHVPDFGPGADEATEGIRA